MFSNMKLIRFRKKSKTTSFIMFFKCVYLCTHDVSLSLALLQNLPSRSKAFLRQVIKATKLRFEKKKIFKLP